MLPILGKIPKLCAVGPYPGSPSTGALPVTSTGLTGATPPSAKAQRSARRAVKEQSKPHGPASVPTVSKQTLAEKLQARRKQQEHCAAPTQAKPPEFISLVGDEVPEGEKAASASGSELDLMDG